MISGKGHPCYIRKKYDKNETDDDLDHTARRYGTGSFAQNLEIKGMVRDARNKRNLGICECSIANNGLFFCGGYDYGYEGAFLLNKIKKGSYILSVSSLGFKTEYISLEGLSKNISLGEISLHDDAVSLDGVTVSASAQTSHADKKWSSPSERQMKASGNGMDLLQQMMLPRVQVDLLNSEIKATGNGVVQVRINGVKVEQDEIKALNPSDIIRIEYHDNPGLRYGNADIVLIISFAGRIREVVSVWTWRKVSIPCG